MSSVWLKYMAECKAETLRMIGTGRVIESMRELETLCKGKTVSVCVGGSCDAYVVQTVRASLFGLHLCRSIKFKVSGFDVPWGFFNVASNCDAVLVVEAKGLSKNPGIFIEEAPELRPWLHFFSDEGKIELTDAEYPVYRFAVRSPIVDVRGLVRDLELFDYFEVR